MRIRGELDMHEVDARGGLAVHACRRTPCLAVVGSDQFSQSWRSALPDGTRILALDAAARVATSETDWTAPPVVVLVDGTEADAEVRVANVRGTIPTALIVVVSTETTPRLAEWILNGDVLLLPPMKGGTIHPSIAQFVAERVARLFRDDWCRRMAPERRPVSASLWLDRAHRCLIARGQTVPLLSGEVAALDYLLDNAGRWVRPTLMSVEAFGRKDNAGVRLVWKYVSRLRAKLNATDVVIETARASGYRLRTLASDGKRR